MQVLNSDPRGRVHSDPLSDVVESLRFTPLFMRMVRVNPPWGFAVPQRDTMCVLHAVTQGTHYWTLEGGPSLKVHPGDIVIVPRGHARSVQDSLDTPLASVETMREISKVLPPARSCADEFIGIGWEVTSASCGHLLLEFLPDVICCRSGQGVGRLLRPTVELLRREYLAQTPGRSAILGRLAETVFIQAIRVWVEQLPKDARGWLRALQDDQIATALQAVHRQPLARWTVESLAAHAGMSRSAFAARFKEVVGKTPMEYVRRWRIERATDLLHRHRISIKQMSAAAGYSSEAAFRASFQKWVGSIPSDYRKTAGRLAMTSYSGRT